MATSKIERLMNLVIALLVHQTVPHGGENPLTVWPGTTIPRTTKRSVACSSATRTNFVTWVSRWKPVWQDGSRPSRGIGSIAMPTSFRTWTSPARNLLLSPSQCSCGSRRN